MKACPPPEEEFLDIFQKIKYSLCLLVSWTWGSRVHFDNGPRGGSHLPVSLGPSAALHHAAWRATTPASRLCASWPGGSLWLLLFTSPSCGPTHWLWRLSLTDGEDHWGASVGRVSGQSSYDHGGHFTASGAFDQRGKGTVEIIGAQLDFALVSVLMHLPRWLPVDLKRNLLVLLSARSSAWPFLRILLSSWMVGSLGLRTRPGDLRRIPLSHSINRTPSSKGGRHGICKWRIVVPGLTECKCKLRMLHFQPPISTDMTRVTPSKYMYVNILNVKSLLFKDIQQKETAVSSARMSQSWQPYHDSCNP